MIEQSAKLSRRIFLDASFRSVIGYGLSFLCLIISITIIVAWQVKRTLRKLGPLFIYMCHLIASTVLSMSVMGPHCWETVAVEVRNILAQIVPRLRSSFRLRRLPARVHRGLLLSQLQDHREYRPRPLHRCQYPPPHQQAQLEQENSSFVGKTKISLKENSEVLSYLLKLQKTQGVSICHSELVVLHLCT